MIKVDLVLEVLKMQLGMTLDPTSFPDPICAPNPRHACSINIVPPFTGEGRIASLTIEGGALTDDPCCPAASIFFKDGDIIKCPPAGNHYLGWIIATGESHDEAQSNLARLTARVIVDIRPI